jgi:4-amino-4-deoxy-L-arabinose transferase-like glycosyltransferase
VREREFRRRRAALARSKPSRNITPMSNTGATAIVDFRVLCGAWLALLAVRIAIAALLPLHGDEAFYWQESRMLAAAYTDLPPLTAWLIALGTAVGGDSLLGIRWPFLVIAAAVPWVMRAWALRRLGDAQAANLVALAAMCLPLVATAGVLALPDVPLTMTMLLSFVWLDRAADSNRWRDWGMLGVALALAALTHWRAATLCTAGLVWVLLTPRGRDALRRPGLWCALLLALAGLLPTLGFNAVNDWAGLRFQAVERNPWSFQADGLWIAFEQFGLLTPPMALALAVISLRAWRQRAHATFDLMLAAALGIVVLYCCAGLFADNERMRIHWPLPGYLPLLLALPALLSAWRQRSGWFALAARWTLPLTALGAGVALAVLAAAASLAPSDRALAARVLGTGFSGWTTAAAATRRLLAELPEDSVLIADNFLLGAELDFALGGKRSPYVLDHPRNVKHGRQTQLALWQRDEAALRAAGWAQGLLVIEVNARAPGARLAAMQALCDRFAGLRWLYEAEDEATAVRFLFAVVRPASAPKGGCVAPIHAHIDFPAPGRRLAAGEELLVQGWAIDDGEGVGLVTVYIDGMPIADARTHLLAPHVRAEFARSRDPDHPNVGFAATIPAAALAPGRHRVDVEVQSRDPRSMARRFGPVWIAVDAAAP